MGQDDKPFSVRTIGPGWSEDPEERARQVAEQQRVVSAMAELLEAYDDYQLGDL